MDDEGVTSAASTSRDYATEHERGTSHYITIHRRMHGMQAALAPFVTGGEDYD
jgi:hypothetical protein